MIKGTLSTDQEDGNIYIKQNGIDFSIESRIEEILKEVYPQFYNTEEGEWYSRIPHVEIEIKIIGLEVNKNDWA